MAGTIAYCSNDDGEGEVGKEGRKGGSTRVAIEEEVEQ